METTTRLPETPEFYAWVAAYCAQLDAEEAFKVASNRLAEATAENARLRALAFQAEPV